MSECNWMIGTKHFIFKGRGPARALKIIGIVLLGIIAIAVLAIVFGIFVKLLWNALMPEIFGLPEIGFWQAVGLAVLAHIFFGAHSGTHRYERRRRRKKAVAAGESEKSPLSREMEQDYTEFWREEGRDAFKSWMRRENGAGPEDG